MTDLDSTLLQLVLALFIFIAGLVLAVAVKGYFRAPLSRSVSLYLWHSLFCVIYLAYVLNYGGDASGYFRMSLRPDIDFAFGTYGVRFVVSFLSQGMGLSFLGCSLVFQLFGFIGLLAFDAALREVTWDKSRNIRLLATFVVFLPSVSFWSSGLGKDSLSFLRYGSGSVGCIEFEASLGAAVGCCIAHAAGASPYGRDAGSGAGRVFCFSAGHSAAATRGAGRDCVGCCRIPCSSWAQLRGCR